MFRTSLASSPTRRQSVACLPPGRTVSTVQEQEVSDCGRVISAVQSRVLEPIWAREQHSPLIPLSQPRLNGAP